MPTLASGIVRREPVGVCAAIVPWNFAASSPAQCGQRLAHGQRRYRAAIPSSGLGRELGPHALDEYTEEKFVHVDLSGRLDRRAYPLLLSVPPA